MGKPGLGTTPGEARIFKTARKPAGDAFSGLDRAVIW